MVTRVKIDDFMRRCPACGAPCIEHSDETAKTNEWWTFRCSAQVVREDKSLIDNQPCRDALIIKLGAFNRSAAAVEAVTDG